MDQSSDSGFVNKPIVSGGTDVFADYVEMPCGGFNRLFRAKRYGKWFVLKGLKPEFSSNPIYRNLLDKEFELGMMLSHPNIVTFYGKEYDAVFGDCIVMECVDGVTLSDFLKTKPSSSIVMKVIEEILSAMSYFHTVQVIHRDIKPSNILVTRNGNNVKIIDFGFSDTDSHVILKQPAGTARYAAPEQVEGTVALDNRADIYSFGVVLKDIVAATGFRGCSAVVRKCTQTNREKRYASAVEVLAAIKSRRKMMVVLPVIVMLLIIDMGTAVLYSHWRNSVAENVNLPVADTVVVSHIDTVVLNRLENVNGNTNLPSQSVLVSPKADTVYGQKMLDEVKERIEALFLTYKKEIENYEGYREFLLPRLYSFTKEANDIGKDVGKNIPDEDLFASQFLHYYYNINYKYYSKLEQMLSNFPSFEDEYRDGIITQEQYFEIGDRYSKYLESSNIIQ